MNENDGLHGNQSQDSQDIGPRKAEQKYMRKMEDTRTKREILTESVQQL